MTSKKIGILTVFFGLVTAYPAARFAASIEGGGGSYLDVTRNPVIGTIYGFAIYSFPFFLGLLGFLWFGKQYSKLFPFIIVPTVLVNLFWIIDGLGSYIVIVVVALIPATIGVGIGLGIKYFTDKKSRAEQSS